MMSDADDHIVERRRAAVNVGVVCIAAGIVGLFTGETGLVSGLLLPAIGVYVIFKATPPRGKNGN